MDYYFSVVYTVKGTNQKKRAKCFAKTPGEATILVIENRPVDTILSVKQHALRDGQKI